MNQSETKEIRTLILWYFDFLGGFLIFYFYDFLWFYFCDFCILLLWFLRSCFVVKFLHFLKESKYFSLSYTTKPKNHGKDWKMYPWNWGVSIRHSVIEQFTDFLFGYVKSVCKIYVLLESKWRHCSVTMVTMAFVLDYLEFYRYFWGFWPYLESGGLFFINGPNFKFGPNCDVTYGNFKLWYLEFGKWYRDGWPLYESQILRRFLGLWLLFNEIQK